MHHRPVGLEQLDVAHHAVVMLFLLPELKYQVNLLIEPLALLGLVLTFVGNMISLKSEVDEDGPLEVVLDDPIFWWV